jgi:transcription elongation factor GreB
MSRAFVREDSERAEELPDLPLGPAPFLMTPRGQRKLQVQLQQAQAELAGLRSRTGLADRHDEAVTRRQIRYLESRLRSALVIDPTTQPAGVVAFGARVRLEDEDGGIMVVHLVGADEADATSGAITVQSPLGAALTGSREGDVVDWRRSAGSRSLTVLTVEFPAGDEIE